VSFVISIKKILEPEHNLKAAVKYQIVLMINVNVIGVKFIGFETERNINVVVEALVNVLRMETLAGELLAGV